jgi:translation initiation factor IF-2
MMANLHNTIKEPAPEAPPPRAPRQKKPEPEHIEPESSDSDSGSESEYEEVNKIKSYFEQEPCESISPAALAQTKTTKEALTYLKSKNCPKIANIKKSAKSIKMESGPPAPGPETAPAKKRVAKPKAAPAPAPALEVTPAPAPVPVEAPKKVKKVKAAPAPTPAPTATPAPAPAAAEKKKRAPSAYASLVGKLVKEKKMSFAEAAKAAKAELDAKKKQ